MRRTTVARPPVPAVTATGRAVPWATVLALAVVLAYADGFWMVSLRGAVGAVERTGSPFQTWVRESSLSLPWFVLAVLAAFTLSLHRTRTRRRGSAAALTALLVVAAATLVGVAELIASAAYDYHLQWSMSREMSAMGGGCVECLAADHRATVALQVRAVAYGAAILLASNLVVVGWLWAVRGGRLDAGTARTPRPGAGAGGRARWPVRSSREDDLRILLTACLVGSAAVHAAVTPEHLPDWRQAGLFFVLLAAGQLAAGATVLLRPRRASLALAAAVSVLPLLTWAVSRTAGLPWGPEPGAPEPVGLADAAAFVLETGVLLLVAALGRARGRPRARLPAPAHAFALVVLAVVCVVAVGLAGSGVGWLDVTVAPAGHGPGAG